MSQFDSVQVVFQHTKTYPHNFTDTKVVPFEKNYFEVIQKILPEIQTDYFWLFANFMDVRTVDTEFSPKHKDQMHVWYNTHPMGGTNKEGNVFLIPTKCFANEIGNMERLKDYPNIVYHAHDNLYQYLITKTEFKLTNPMEPYKDNSKFYIWLKNISLRDVKYPDFYPSFWEGVMMYSWGKTKDIMLVPKMEIDDFLGLPHVNFELDYDVKKLDVFRLDEDTMLNHVLLASKSTTDYFIAIPPGVDVPDDFDYDFQPDRLAKPCHYLIGDVRVLNKNLCMDKSNLAFDPKLAIKL